MMYAMIVIVNFYNQCPQVSMQVFDSRIQKTLFSNRGVFNCDSIKFQLSFAFIRPTSEKYTTVSYFGYAYFEPSYFTPSGFLHTLMYINDVVEDKQQSTEDSCFLLWYHEYWTSLGTSILVTISKRGFMLKVINQPHDESI